MKVNQVQPTKTYSPAKKAAKTAAKAVATAAVATGAVLYLSKTGKLNPKEGGNVVLETVKSVLKKPADFISNKATELGNTIRLASKGNPKVSAVTDKIDAMGRTINEKKTQFLNSDLKANIDKHIDTLKDFVESKFNKEKFSETAKAAAEDFIA